jgi:hypothetical protein
MCPLWWKSSWELQGMYGLQGPTTPLHFKIHTPPAQIKQTLYTQPRATYTHITKQNSYAPTNIEQEPHIANLICKPAIYRN